MKLSVVIVNYNVKYFLEQALYSVKKACNGIDSEIIVVDNHSVDGSCEMVKHKFANQVILIENKERVYNKRKPLYLIVARTNGCNSKPCARCLELIEKNLHIINIRQIYYTHEDEQDGIKMDKLKTLITGEKFVSSYSRFLTKQKNKQTCKK